MKTLLNFLVLGLLLLMACGRPESESGATGYVDAMNTKAKSCEASGGHQWLFNGPDCNLTGYYCVRFTDDSIFLNNTQVEKSSCEYDLLSKLKN